MFPLYDTARSRSFPVVNWSLIAVNVLVFLYELQLSASGLQGFIKTWGLVPARLLAQPAAAWVTIFAAVFLHGGWFHILSNMWVLFIFGDNVEDRMGPGGYLVFYLLSGVAAGLLQAFVLPTSTQPMVGASGAIAGVLGAYLILFPGARVASLVPILFIFTIIEIPALVFLLFWFVTQLFSGLMSLNGASGGGSGIAWWAHVGGFLFGMLGSQLFARRPGYRTW
ncbi:MAG TPA: rhomboid family intramembrane serine protease [Anaerolineales bacterium]|jgi:membrane associated rhomboid family serine protease